MTVTVENLVIWLIIATIVGFLGEVIAGRRVPDGIIGAILLGFLAIFLIVGVLHMHIQGEPILNGVPLISSILSAALLVLIWSAFAYHRVYRRSYGHTYRHERHERRSRRRFRMF